VSSHPVHPGILSKRFLSLLDDGIDEREAFRAQEISRSVLLTINFLFFIAEVQPPCL
jgi:hypothetical protein